MIYGGKCWYNCNTEKRLGWAGHVWQAQGRLIKEVTKWTPLGSKRSLGRPRQRWVDRIKMNLSVLGIDDGEDVPKWSILSKKKNVVYLCT